MKLSTRKHHIFVCFLTGRRAILTSASWLVDNLFGFVQPMKDLTLSITWQMVVITGLWQPNQVNNNNLVQLAVFPHHSHLCLVVLQLICRIRGHQLGEAMFRARYAVLCPDVFNLTIAQLLPCMYINMPKGPNMLQLRLFFSFPVWLRSTVVCAPLHVSCESTDVAVKEMQSRAYHIMTLSSLQFIRKMSPIMSLINSVVRSVCEHVQ